MIKVIDHYVIDTDGRQYVAGRLATRTTKEGANEQYIADPAYYTTFAGCLGAIARRMRMNAIKNTDGDMEAAMQALQAVDKRLMKAIGAYDDIEVVQKK